MQRAHTSHAHVYCILSGSLSEDNTRQPASEKRRPAILTGMVTTAEEARQEVLKMKTGTYKSYRVIVCKKVKFRILELMLLIEIITDYCTLKY